MKISKWKLENAGPFKGVHELDLGTTGVDVFAVTARYEADEERSNWAGKSFLMKTLPLALFDEYPSETADGWVSDGAAKGAIRVELDDGTTAERSRDVSKAKPVVSFVAGINGDLASGEQGTARLAEYLGVREAKEFFSTSFVRQKAVNRFVAARPGERLQIVSEWIGLSKLRECRKQAGELYRKARREASELAEESPVPLLERLERDVTGILYREDTDPDELIAIVEKEYRKSILLHVEEDESKLRVARAKYEEAVKKEREYGALARDAAEFERLATEGRVLQKEIEEAPPEVKSEQIQAAQKERDRLAAFYAEYRGACAKAEKLRRGEFDGCCPVNGRDCPVRDEINADAERAEARYRANRADRDDAEKFLRKAESDLSELKIARDELVELRASLKRTADAARRLKEARDAFRATEGAPTPSAVAGEAYEAAQRFLEGSRGDLRAVDSWLADWRAYAARRAKKAGAAEKARAALAVAADAVEVFERAEREIGQAVLGDIEEMANLLLANAGIRLDVRMTWGRETNQLEGTCHRCGWQYPRGRGTKVCEDCGAPRRPKIEERLDLVASERSDGAAEDLAGLAVQLASAAWRRAETGTRLGVVVLDEVTASFDRANRRAIGAVLAQMIRDAGFEQGFVISHSPDVVESLPGRIEIVVGRDGTRRIEVR